MDEETTDSLAVHILNLTLYFVGVHPVVPSPERGGTEFGGWIFKKFLGLL